MDAETGVAERKDHRSDARPCLDWLNVLGVCLFILIGLGVLYAAIRATCAKNIGGWAVFTMESVPGVIGGKLRGSIQTRIQSDFNKEVTLSLSSSASSSPRVDIGAMLQGAVQNRCGGDHGDEDPSLPSSSSSAPLEKKVPRERMQEGPQGLKIPVDFDIPASCEGTNIWDPERKVVWTLRALAGPDDGPWDASFVVPIFKTGSP